MDKRNTSIKELEQYIHNKYAKLIEKSIFNYANEYVELNEIKDMFDDIYDTKYTELLQFIKISKDFVDQISDGTINPLNIAYMKEQDLNPSKYEKINNRKKLEEHNINNMAVSTSRKCKKCKKNKCNVTRKQTRAADEPETIFVECLECGYSYVIN